MTTFSFRAQAALDLRARQDEDARRALAAAEAQERLARETLARVVADLERSMARTREEDAKPGHVTTKLWYRNWIAGQQQQVRRCRQIVEMRQADVRAATERAQAARRKLKSLERFRDRLRRRYTAAERREEQKLFDALGTIRFALERPNPGGGT
jgi:flagellar export protein FliJ